MQSSLKGRDVLIMMLIFFGVVIGVNALMITYAVTTFSGEDAAHSYVQGLHFNSTLAARNAQHKAGWQARIETAPAAQGQVVIVLSLRDRQANPVTGVALTGSLRLPATSREDHTLNFSETAPGHYEATLEGVHPAYWDVVVNGQKDGAADFETRYRLWIR